MPNGKNGNGVVLKSMMALAGVCLTVALTLLARERVMGREEQKVLVLEAASGKHEGMLILHDREIATLKAQWAAIEKQIGDQGRKLDALLERVPARPAPP